jgi:purine-binding chemotaxis protein CheW
MAFALSSQAHFEPALADTSFEVHPGNQPSLGVRRSPAMSNQLVVFTLDERLYALPLARVQRVVRVVEVTPLPKAPDIVLGVMNLQGTIIPVMSMRTRFGLPETETNLSDQIIVADTATRTVGLLVNSVTGIIERNPEEIAVTEKIVPGAQYVEGITKTADGILFIHNIDRFLSTQEEQQLEKIMTQPEGDQ